MILLNAKNAKPFNGDPRNMNRDQMSRVALNLTIAGSADEAVIDIEGVIGEDWWNWSEDYVANTSENVRKALRDITAKKVIVNINSLGGYVNEGLAIHDLLTELNAEVETRVYGMTASAATVIAQASAGKKARKMSKNAMYLIHQAWTFAAGTAKQLRQQAEDLEKINGVIAKLYSAAGSKDVAHYTEIMDRRDGEGEWLTAEEALEYGLIDEIIEPAASAAKNVSTAPEPPAATQPAQNSEVRAALARQLQILNLKAKQFEYEQKTAS